MNTPDKNSLVQLMEQALQYHRKGDPGAAETLYGQVVQALPGNAEALHLWGVTAHELGHPQQAVTRIGRALALGGPRADFLLDLGQALLALRRLEPAKGCFTQALTLQPEFPEAMAALGNLALEAENYNMAQEWYLKALALKENYPQAYYNLAMTFKKQSREIEAMKAFHRALTLDPGHWKAHFNLGLMLLLKNHTQDAVTHFQQAVVARPTYLRAQWAFFLALPILYENDSEMAPARQRWLNGVAEIEKTFHPSTPEAILEAKYAAESFTNFHLHYQGENDLEAQRAYGRLLTRMAHLVYPGHNTPLAVSHPVSGRNNQGWVCCSFSSSNDLCVSSRCLLKSSSCSRGTSGCVPSTSPKPDITSSVDCIESAEHPPRRKNITRNSVFFMSNFSFYE